MLNDGDVAVPDCQTPDAIASQELVDWVTRRLGSEEQEALRVFVAHWNDQHASSDRRTSTTSDTDQVQSSVALNELARSLDCAATLAFKLAPATSDPTVHALCLRIANYCGAAARRVEREKLFLGAPLNL